MIKNEVLNFFTEITLRNGESTCKLCGETVFFTHHEAGFHHLMLFHKYKERMKFRDESEINLTWNA
jgi:hypothetical protein